MLPRSFEHMFVSGSFMQNGNHIERVGHSMNEQYPYLVAYFPCSCLYHHTIITVSSKFR